MTRHMDPQVTAQTILLAREGPVATAELRAFLDAQNIDALTGLVATMWVGRGSFEAEEWALAHDTAEAEASTPTADYLINTPQLADHLEAGIEALGLSVMELENTVMGR